MTPTYDQHSSPSILDRQTDIARGVKGKVAPSIRLVDQVLCDRLVLEFGGVDKVG